MTAILHRYYVLMDVKDMHVLDIHYDKVSHYSLFQHLYHQCIRLLSKTMRPTDVSLKAEDVCDHSCIIKMGEP